MLNSRINAYAQWDAWFVFNLLIKKGGSVIHIHALLLLHYSLHNSIIHTHLHTYLSSQVLAALLQMSLSLLSSQSRLSYFTHHVG
jgi:hypothetical protein